MYKLPILTAIGILTLSYTIYRTYKIYRCIKQAERNLQQHVPSLILVLGGDKQREYAAVDLYHKIKHNNNNVKLLISSGEMDYRYDNEIYDLVENNQCICDYNAVDTITNFTTTIQYILKHHHKHIIVLTSDYHIHRALIAAQLIYICGYGIAITPFACITDIDNNNNNSEYIKQIQSETSFKHYRDMLRCIIWLYTGISGETLNYIIHPKRVEAAKRNTTQNNLQN